MNRDGVRLGNGLRWLWIFPQSTGIGGTERRVVELVPALLDRGSTVSAMLVGPPEGAFAQKLQSAGAEVRCFSSVLGVATYLRRAPAGSRVIAFEKNAALAVSLSRMRPERYLLAQSSLDAAHTGPKRLLSRFLTRRADEVITNSRAASQFVSDTYGVPRRQVRYLPPALADEWFTDCESDTRVRPSVVGMVGNLRPEKRYDVAMDVISRLPVDLTVRIFSNGQASLLDMAADAGVSDRVEIVHGKEMTPSDYDQLGVLLHTAQFESMPRAILEACSRKCPVAAFGVGDIPQYVSGTVPFPSTRELAARVVELSHAGDWSPIANGISVREYAALLESDPY